MQSMKYLGYDIDSSKRLEEVFKDAKKGIIDIDEDVILKAIQTNKEAFKSFIGERIDNDKELKKLLESHKYDQDVGFVSATQEFSKDYINKTGLKDSHDDFVVEMEKVKKSWFAEQEETMRRIKQKNTLEDWLKYNNGYTADAAKSINQEKQYNTNPKKWTEDHMKDIDSYVLMKGVKKPNYLRYSEASSAIEEFIEVCKMMYLGEKYTNACKANFMDFMSQDKEFVTKAVVTIREMVNYVLFKSYIWETVSSSLRADWRETLKTEGYEYVCEVFPEIKTHTIKKAMMK